MAQRHLSRATYLQATSSRLARVPLHPLARWAQMLLDPLVILFLSDGIVSLSGAQARPFARAPTATRSTSHQRGAYKLTRSRLSVAFHPGPHFRQCLVGPKSPFIQNRPIYCSWQHRAAHCSSDGPQCAGPTAPHPLRANPSSRRTSSSPRSSSIRRSRSSSSAAPQPQPPTRFPTPRRRQRSSSSTLLLLRRSRSSSSAYLLRFPHPRVSRSTPSTLPLPYSAPPLGLLLLRPTPPPPPAHLNREGPSYSALLQSPPLALLLLRRTSTAASAHRLPYSAPPPPLLLLHAPPRTTGYSSSSARAPPPPSTARGALSPADRDPIICIAASQNRVAARAPPPPRCSSSAARGPPPPCTARVSLSPADPDPVLCATATSVLVAAVLRPASGRSYGPQGRVGSPAGMEGGAPYGAFVGFIPGGGIGPSSGYMPGVGFGPAFGYHRPMFFLPAGANQPSGAFGPSAGANIPPGALGSTTGYRSPSKAAGAFTSTGGVHSPSKPAFDFFSQEGPSGAGESARPPPGSPPGLSRLALDDDAEVRCRLNLQPFDDVPAAQLPPRSARAAGLGFTFTGKGGRRAGRGVGGDGSRRSLPPGAQDYGGATGGEAPSRRRSKAKGKGPAVSRPEPEPAGRVTRSRAMAARGAAAAAAHADDSDEEMDEGDDHVSEVLSDWEAKLRSCDSGCLVKPAIRNDSCSRCSFTLLFPIDSGNIVSGYKLNAAKVVAVGPGERDREGKLIPVALKEGDTVLLPEYGGTEVKLAADKEYLLFREHDILGTLHD
ncbi:hypothetical protein HU200_038551 [Digitaria exilis]|uniref:Uncharacterized protein n=1 Tax=Digitaria exilis TaxID=1010633 RepID=A0A835BCU3_9POAL|nr:hypothetical protein HU200_038551 [Digitaria exilis]